MEASVEELKKAFKDTGLWRNGWTFNKAISTEIIATQLMRIVRNRRANSTVKQPTLF